MGLGPDAGGVDWLPAPGRDQARPRRDGRLRRLRCAVVGYLLPVGPDDLGHHVRRHLGGGQPAGAVGRSADELEVSFFGAIAFLEWWGENSYALAQSGEKHYMRGGKPGYYPSFNKGGIPHPVPLELFDPFGFTKSMSAERKEKALLAEINNGRLAQLGIMAFVSEAKIPGSVPALKGLIAPYAGNPMGPFTAADATNLPYVTDMINGPFAF